MSGAVAVTVEGLSCAYRRRQALDRVSLEVGRGEIFTLVGPSGSGKSTLLRAVAGFERPVAGRVLVDGTEVAGPTTWVEPHRRSIALVPQGDSLFPHLRVIDNVGFGVRADPHRASAALELVGLAERARSYPAALSGGERQRVALARALAPGRGIVLLDEPFSAIDAELRLRLRREVVDILRRSDATALIVTHDQEEALAVGDRIGVLREGRLVQVGRPVEVYRRPADTWVASFLGEVNVVAADLAAGVVRTSVGVLPAPDRRTPSVGIRPESLRLSADTTAGSAVVLQAEYRGRDVRYVVRHDEAGELIVVTTDVEMVAPGSRVTVALTPDAVAIPFDPVAA